MENLFNEELQKQIFELSKKNKLDNTTEFEIRIGSYDKFGFSPGISKEKFSQLRGEIRANISAATDSITGLSELQKAANKGDEDAMVALQEVAINSVDYLKYSFEGSVIAFDEKILQDNIDLKRKIDLAKIGYEKLELPKYVKTEDDLIKVLLYYAEEE